MAAKLKLNLVVQDDGSVVVKKFGKTADTAFRVGKAGAIAMGAGVAGMVASLYAANKIMSEAVGLANKQEAAEAKLGAVLTATGEAAGINLDQMKAMAAQMQATTTVGDEVILNGMAILSTFKEIKGEAFEGATKAALDMSQVMGQDLKSSMVQLGKALNDPVKGLAALSRVGVSFTEAQKEQIKALQEAGKMAEAQAVILRELQSEFGGAAEAARETFGGSVLSAKGALSDMKEEIGFTITKSKFMIDLVHMAESQFMAWGGQIKDNRAYLQSLTKRGILYLVDGFKLTLKVMKFFHLGWLGLRKVGNLTIRGLVEGVKMLFNGLRLLLKPFDILFKTLVKLGRIATNPFDDMDASIDRLSLSVDDVTADIERNAEVTKRTYDGVIGKVEEWREGISEIPVAQAQASAAVIKTTKDTTKAIVVAEDEKKKKTKETTRAMTQDWEVFSQSSAQGLISDFINPTKDSFLDLGNFHGQLLSAMITNWVDLLAQMLVEQATFQRTSQTMWTANATQGGVTGAATLPSVASGAAMTAPVFGLNPLTGGLIGVGGGMMLGQATGAGQGEAFLGSAAGAALGGWLAAGTLLGGPLGAVLGGLAGGALSGIVDDVGDFVGDAFDAVGDFFGGIFHKGGMVKALYAHAGRFLKHDEVPVIAQTGEAFLNRATTRRLGGEAGINALNRGASLGGEITIRVMFDDDRLKDLIRFEADGVRIEELRRNPGLTRMYT